MMSFGQMTQPRRPLWRIVFAILFLLTVPGTVLAAPLKLAPNPEWCRPGYRCLSISDYGAMTEIKIHLEEKLKIEKAGSRHFGIGCAVGPSLGIAVDENLNAHFVPTVAVTCGAVIKF